MNFPPPGLPTPPPPFRERGSTRLILALTLLGTVVGGAGGLIQVAMGGGQEDSLVAPPPGQLPQRLVVLTLCGILNAGCAVAMWSYRRWGVYGVVVASLVAFVVNWRMGGVPVAVPGLIAVGVTAAFAMAAWVQFD